MAGRNDDDLTDLASDLAEDPELAATFAKLAEAPLEPPPHSGSEFKNPLQGFIDRDRITPKLPHKPSSIPGFAVPPPPSASKPGFSPPPPPPSSKQGFSTPASKRAPSVRAFIAQSPPPSSRSGQPAPHAPPSQRSAAAARPTPIENESSSVPGIERLYPDRDTPTVRFMKGGSPDSDPIPTDSELEELSASSAPSSSEPISDSVASAPLLLTSTAASEPPSSDALTMPRDAPSSNPSYSAPSSAPFSGPPASGEAPASGDVAEMSRESGELSTDEEDGAGAGTFAGASVADLSAVDHAQAARKTPRVWLLAVASILTAGCTLALLVVFGPLRGEKVSTPHAPAGPPMATVKATTAPALPPPLPPQPPPASTATLPASATPDPTAAPTATTAAAPPALSADPVTVGVSAPALTFRPAAPLTGRLPTRAVPTASSRAPAPPTTTKPATGPIFELP